MPTVKALNLGKQIEKDGLYPAYVLEGEDEALISQSIAILRDAVERDDLPGSTTAEHEEVDQPGEIFDELRTQPFMGMEGMRLVIVRDGKTFIKEHSEALVRYLESPATKGILVLQCEKLDKRRKASKAILDVGLGVDCSSIRWSDARKWLTARAREEGKRLDGQARDALIQAVGPNIKALGNELEKLVLFVGGRDQITARDVRELVSQSRVQSIFDLGDAIAAGNQEETFRLGEHLLLHGESLPGIIGFLGYRTRTLWQVKRLVKAGKNPRAISSEVGMPPFAAKKAARIVRRLNPGWFQRRLETLAEADIALKTRSLRSREQATWLTALLARLCA